MLIESKFQWLILQRQVLDQLTAEGEIRLVEDEKMEKIKSIKEFLKRIKPFQEGLYLVELFGSYARGDYTPNSDIDLLVVLKNRKLRGKLLDAVDSAMQAVEYRELLSPVIMDAKHYHKIKNFNSDFYHFIKKEGKTLWKAKT